MLFNDIYLNRIFFTSFCAVNCSNCFSLVGDWIISGVLRRIRICNCWIFLRWLRIISFSSSILSIAVRSSLILFDSLIPIINESSALRRRCRIDDLTKPKIISKCFSWNFCEYKILVGATHLEIYYRKIEIRKRID